MARLPHHAHLPQASQRTVPRMVKQCPTCGGERCKIVDVKSYKTLRLNVRTHRCMDCRRIISTEEKIVDPDRKTSTLRVRKHPKKTRCA